ncbi:hypothetical protein GB928_018745 [Shinella curvata]|uniref:Uncharacterized protein n=1 Tax=Shinella curvata TaxID=1817964 RepID=A0ABT8XIZ2_9HYPH|nr:hypothetical protein [Shinella curvata]MCJ8053899.1 hypothetical protein [Shinella curvata]MDO6123231.1 hypothetical protein [Shinella curvata]
METCAGFWDFWAGLNLSSVQWLEWAKAAFDLLKGIAWPAAIFWLVFLFRKQIRERIPHVIEVGPTRALFQQPQAQPIKANASIDGSPDRLATVVELEKDVKARLERIAPEYREVELVRAVAESRLVANFEYIFASIFASQIDFLLELTKSPRGEGDSELYFTQSVLSKDSEFFSEIGFERWRAYLLSQELAVLHEEKIEITDKGKDFLWWVERAKQGFIRPG